MSKTSIHLAATPREQTGRAATAELKANARVAGIMYGSGVEPTQVSVDLLELNTVFHKAGESQIVTLALEGEEHPVLIKALEFDPKHEEPRHVDFWRIDLTKAITAPVPVLFEGTSVAVKDEGGTLVRVLTEIEVKALPTDIPEAFHVDISELATFEDSIGIEDLDVPEGVEILNDINETIALVEAPRSEEEMEALEGAVDADVSAIEGVEKDGEEEGEGEESEEKSGEKDEASSNESSEE